MVGKRFEREEKIICGFGNFMHSVLKGRYFEEEGLEYIFQDLLFAVEGALLLACLCRGPPALATITER